MLAFLLLLAPVQDDAKEAEARALRGQLLRAVVLYAETHGAFPKDLDTLIDEKILLMDAVPKDPWGDPFTYELKEGQLRFGIDSDHLKLITELTARSVKRRETTVHERTADMFAAAIHAYRDLRLKMPKDVDELLAGPGVLVERKRVRHVKMESWKGDIRFSVDTRRFRTLSPKEKETLQEQIGNLSSDAFATREAATKKIKDFGHGALEIVREARGKARDLEVRTRLTSIEQHLGRQSKEPRLVRYAFARSRVRRNHRNVAACLRSIVTAQENFKSNDLDRNSVNDYWTGDIAGLYCLQVNTTENAVAALNDIGVASADAAAGGKGFSTADTTYNKALLLKHWPKHGYLFQAMQNDPRGAAYAGDTDNSGFAVHNFGTFGAVAYPAEYGVSGRYTFIINEGASVFRRDTGGKPVLRYPTARELSKDWKRAR